MQLRVGLTGDHRDLVAEIGQRAGKVLDVHALATAERIAAVAAQGDVQWRCRVVVWRQGAIGAHFFGISSSQTPAR